MTNIKLYYHFIVALLILIFTSCDFSKKESSHLNNRFYEKAPMAELCYKKIKGMRYYYRKAGNPLNPTLVLMHGFPTNKKTFDELIPMLASHYYVIAPDHTETDWTETIDPSKTKFSFSKMTEHLEVFLDELHIDTYTLYIQNSAMYVGFDLMYRNPNKVNALILQNVDLYVEGLSPKRKDLFERAGSDYNAAYQDFLWSLTGEGKIECDQHLLDLDTSYFHQIAKKDEFKFLNSKKKRKAMLQLFEDYNNILTKYPKWQKMLRDLQPKTLVIWGDDEVDVNFKGAKLYQKDLPDTEFILIKSGKYSDDMFTVEIASQVLTFLQKNVNDVDKNLEIKPYLDAL